jgi:1-acyl-sn-glycerol-3-phosphate acyltransferase
MLSFLQCRRRNDGNTRWNLLIWFTLVPCVVLTLLKLFYGLRLMHANRLPRTGPILVLANHQSHLDPMILGAALRDRAPRAMARKSLMEGNGLAGWFIGQAFRSIPVDRDTADHKAMRTVLAELHAGRAVSIFPEGRRHADGTVHPFERGIWLLVKRGGADILPVGFAGTGDVWPLGASRPRRGRKMGLLVGEPIPHGEVVAMGEVEGLAWLRARVEALAKEARWWN